MCIDFVKVWFGIANEQISSNFDGVIRPRHTHISVPVDNLSKCQGILTKLGRYIDIQGTWFGIANGQISLFFFFFFFFFFDRAICPRHDYGGVLSFYVFIVNI